MTAAHVIVELEKRQQKYFKRTIVALGKCFDNDKTYSSDQMFSIRLWFH